jgi:hypothetical protein
MIFTTNTLLALVSVVLASLRVGGLTSEAFQAVAHLWVGGLFAAGYVQYSATWGTDRRNDAMLKIWLGVGLSVIELACFLFGRFGMWWLRENL